jgi:hypothetical protein
VRFQRPGFVVGQAATLWRLGYAAKYSLAQAVQSFQVGTAGHAVLAHQGSGLNTSDGAEQRQASTWCKVAGRAWRIGVKHDEAAAGRQGDGFTHGVEQALAILQRGAREQCCPDCSADLRHAEGIGRIAVPQLINARPALYALSVGLFIRQEVAVAVINVRVQPLHRAGLGECQHASGAAASFGAIDGQMGLDVATDLLPVFFECGQNECHCRASQRLSCW